jgi:hypothetical protein
MVKAKPVVLLGLSIFEFTLVLELTKATESHEYTTVTILD